MNQLSSLSPGISTASTEVGTDSSASSKSAAKRESDDSSPIASAHDGFDKHLPSPHRTQVRHHATQNIAIPDQNSPTLPAIAKQEDKKASKDSSPSDSGSADPASTTVSNQVVPLAPLASPLVCAFTPTVETAENSESDHVTTADMPSKDSRLPSRLSVISPALVPLDVASSPIRGKETSAGESDPTVLPEEAIAGTIIDRSIRVPMPLDATLPPVKEKEKSADQSKPRIISEGSVAKKITDRSPEESPLTPAARAVGTNAAKQHVAMSIAEIETIPKSEVLPNQPLSVTATPDQSHPSISSAEDSSFTPRQGDADSHPAPGDLTEPTIVAAAKCTVPAARPEPTLQTPNVQKVSHLFEEVSQAIERLRTDSRTNVELQIKLHDGGQLIVKVQMHAGEVKTTFKTDSTEWREAIAQGWSSFSSDSANRGMRVTNPVFESPSAQNGLNDFDNQRQQRRDQAEAMAPDQTVTPRAWKKASLPTPAPSPLREASLRGKRITVWA